MTHALGWLPEDIPKDARVTPVVSAAPPTHFEWTQKDGQNWMTSVKDQGGCGSCVAFAAVGALEGQLKIQTNNPSWNIDLSEQHLFSCSGGTCSGGETISSALNYLQQYGTPDEACSPYQGGSGSCSNSCPDWQSRASKISSWSWVANNPSAIEAALMNGPLIAGFTVYADFYYAYNGGVYHWDHVSQPVGGHAIVIVGYDQPGQYWVVKNSWGASWGVNGYFRIGFGEAGIENYVATIKAGAGPSATSNDASITGNDIPASMIAGQTYTVHVTVQNTGSSTWTAAGGYKLGAVGDSDPFAYPRVMLDPSDSIGSSQSKTYTFTMTAPGAAGSYVTDWRMLREGVAWFGATLVVQVTVQAGPESYGAVITVNDMPTSMVAGESYVVHITVQNTGTNTWTAADAYKLGAAGDVNPFGPIRVLFDPSDSIATGQSKMFTFTLTAPGTLGTYTATWQMVREGVTWFGGVSKVTVSVSAGTKDATIMGSDIPVTMVAGQMYTVHITVQNTGTTTWTPARNYGLGFVGDKPPFGPGRIYLDPSASVAPGQQYTFTFTITAPNTASTYTMQYRMLQEGVAWFGQTATTTLTVQ